MARIAVIDDDPAHRDLAAALFASRDWTAITVPDGQSITEWLSQARPDAILLDMRLGGGQNGWDVLEHVQSEPGIQAIPVVIWTADRSSLGEKQGWLQEQGIPVLSKPFESDDLFRCFEQVLPELLRGETDLLACSAPRAANAGEDRSHSPISRLGRSNDARR